MNDERSALARVETAEMVLPEREQRIERARPEARIAVAVRQTDDVDALQMAFAEAWIEFPVIPKNRVAKIQKGAIYYEYKYADLSDVKRLVDPVLKEKGLAFMCIPSGGKLIGRLIHAESGQWLEGDLAIVPPDSRGGCQALGSALTYTRRYLTSNMLNLSLEEGEDDDGAAASAHQPAAARDPGRHNGHQTREPREEPDPQAEALDIAARAVDAAKTEITALMRRADRLPEPHRHVAVSALLARLYTLAPSVAAVGLMAKYARDCGASEGFIRGWEERRRAELSATMEPATATAAESVVGEATTPEEAAQALARARQEPGEHVAAEIAFAVRIARAADEAGDEAQLVTIEALLKQASLARGSEHLALAQAAIETARRDMGQGT
jgi:hypothetical protein